MDHALTLHTGTVLTSHSTLPGSNLRRKGAALAFSCFFHQARPFSRCFFFEIGCGRFA